MKYRRLPAYALLTAAACLAASNLYTAVGAYPTLPQTLSGGIGKPIALFVPVLAAVTWTLLFFASRRAHRLLLPLPFHEAGMNDAREVLSDTLSFLSLVSCAGFFIAERFLLAGRTIPGWLYAVLLLLMLAAAAYAAFAIIRIAKKRGIAEKEVTEAEAEAAWDAFIKNKP